MVPPLHHTRSKACDFMHLLRFFTIVATLLSLPAYGWAAVAHTRSCQEQVNAVHEVVIAGDCCPHQVGKKAPCELPDKNDTCSTCNAGHNCKSPQTYQPTQLPLTVIVPVRQVAVGNPPPMRLPSPSPDRLWRPPALI